MKKDVKSGLAEVALEQLNIAFNPSIEQTQAQIEATADASDQVKLDPSTVEEDRQTLYLHEHKIIQSDKIVQGSTITYFDVRKLYDGFYFLKVMGKNFSKIEKIKISH